MVHSENGTYTAIRRRAFYHCTRSHPKLSPSQIGEFFLPDPVYLLANAVKYVITASIDILA